VGPITDCPDILVNGELWNPSKPPLEGLSGNQKVGMSGNLGTKPPGA